MSSTSQQQPPAKRPRNDATDSDVEPERSDIWYEDGNIVLSADGKMLFCVYRGILSAKSPVFRDMFSLCQPDAQETVDGKSVVRLQDSPEDIAHMLHGLYDWQEHFPPDRPWSIPAIMALLRTGSKYQIDQLRKEAISYLYRHFATTLDTFDPLALWKFKEDDHQSGILLAQCALSHGLQSIVPALFAGSNAFSVSNLMDNFEGEAPATQKLSSANLRRLLHATQRLSIWQVTKIPLCFNEDTEDCETPETCRPAERELITRLFSSGTPNNFAALLVPYDSVHWPQLCETCRVHTVSGYQTQRQNLWDNLPSFLGLPSWDNLKKERELILA